MGLFKDLKNAKDMVSNAREVAAEHGGMPSMREGLRDANMALDDRGEREILKTGTAVRAVVKGVTMPVQGDRFAMQVPLELHPAQGEPYLVDYIFPATRMQAPLMLGMEVPVKVASDDPKRIAVQWDALKASVAAGGGAFAVATKGLDDASGGVFSKMAAGQPFDMPAPPAGFDPTAFTAPAAAPHGDPKARLAKLDELRDAGLIDYSDYQTKKQQILDEL